MFEQMSEVNQGDGDSDCADWERAHQELSRLAKTRAGLDFEEGQWLVRALRAGAHARLGFAGFTEYAERLFDIEGWFRGIVRAIDRRTAPIRQRDGTCSGTKSPGTRSPCFVRR